MTEQLKRPYHMIPDLEQAELKITARLLSKAVAETNPFVLSSEKGAEMSH